jgi:hypothetical protein
MSTDLSRLKNQIRLERNFLNFHTKNPAVWTEFQRYAFEAIRAGRVRYSARFIIHKIRWDSAINTSKTSAFKISNDHSPYYARLFNKTFPKHNDLFKTILPDTEVAETVRNHVHPQSEMAV